MSRFISFRDYLEEARLSDKDIDAINKSGFMEITKIPGVNARIDFKAHAVAQAYQRHPNKDRKYWETFIKDAWVALKNTPRVDKDGLEYLIFSKSRNHGMLVQKRDIFVIITCLELGKKEVRTNKPTEPLIIEDPDFELIEIN